VKDLSGVSTALITPFKDGAVDWASFKKLLRFQLDGGVNGFVVNGTTGESPTLSAKEKQDLFKFVQSETGGQVPLIMGTGSNSTSDSIAATQDAASWGADAALVVVPYYNKPPQRGLFQHFQKIAECSDLPIILYNVPGRTITRLELETISELSHIKGIVGIKEATGDLAFGANVVRHSKKGFLMLSGDDGTFINLIGAGASGVISVASHILPKEFSQWCSRARNGDAEPVAEFALYTDLSSYLYVEANPIPLKMALYLMGIIASPELRLPLTKLSEPFTMELKKKMRGVGLL
jgi:4-hydroxy-tetrahydrodipicolinate synthase